MEKYINYEDRSDSPDLTKDKKISLTPVDYQADVQGRDFKEEYSTDTKKKYGTLMEKELKIKKVVKK